MATKICKYCGAEFSDSYNSQKYCSDNCRHMGQVISQRKYYRRLRHKDFFKARRHNYWIRKKYGGNNENLDQD